MDTITTYIINFLLLGFCTSFLCGSFLALHHFKTKIHFWMFLFSLLATLSSVAAFFFSYKIEQYINNPSVSSTPHTPPFFEYIQYTNYALIGSLLCFGLCFVVYCNSNTNLRSRLKQLEELNETLQNKLSL